MLIFSVFQNVLKLLTREQKKRFYYLIPIYLISACMQIFGVASIAPFIGIVSNNDLIHKNYILSFLYKFLNFYSEINFIKFLGVSTIFLILISNIITALTLKSTVKFCMEICSELQSLMFFNSIRKDYLFHKITNYTTIISKISQELPRFTYMILYPLLLFISNAIIATIIIVGLFVINPLVSLICVLTIGGGYFFIFKIIKRRLVVHGRQLSERNKKIHSLLSESFIGIKDIKLSCFEDKYSKYFTSVNQSALNSSTFITLAGDLPRFAIEAISFSLLMCYAITIVISDEHSGNAISMLSIYALAAYKLLPTLQQVYKSLSSISANSCVISEIEYLLFYQKNDNTFYANHVMNIESITLNNIYFQYPDSNKDNLKNINFIFKRGCINTIAGESGSGKSTLVDVMLGLLNPYRGFVVINNEKLCKTFLKSYYKSIGYVPQSIFMLDDTIMANVAFGVEFNKIDQNKVVNSLKKANAYEFVQKMPNGVLTPVGQDGKLLSGGQKQRIAIARALYRDSKILVLDEPTSSLDVNSELLLIDLLEKLKNDVLIVIISHSLSAIKISLNICFLNNGEMLGSGSYSDLLKSNTMFKSIISKFNYLN